MDAAIKVSGDVTVAGQPSEQRLRELFQDGFKSIVNFRTEGEEDMPLSPSAEGEAAQALDIQYYHIPISLKSLRPEMVDQFRQQFSGLPKPVYAHCKGGTRAGVMVLMHLAVEQGLTGQDALRKADELGIRLNQPQIREFMTNYINSRSGRCGHR